MKKLIVGVGVLFLTLLVYASSVKTLYVGLVVVDGSAPDGKSDFSREIEDTLRRAMGEIPGFLPAAKLNKSTLSEIKLAVLQGKEFPPELQQSLSSDVLVIVKSWKSNGRRFVSMAVVDEAEGEIRGVTTFPFRDVGDLEKRFKNLMERLYMPVPAGSTMSVERGGYYVTVVARGMGKGPATIARKIALLDAKRRAVEKAIGAVVDVKIVPESERSEIVSRTMGQLKYRILSAGREGTLYAVTISASVLVPAGYVKKFPPQPVTPPPSTGYPPLVARGVDGVKIDWEKGFILAEGKGRIKGDLLAGRRAAIVVAQSRALRALEGVRIKGEKRAGDLGMEYHLRGLVKGGSIVREGTDGDFYRVVLKVPIYGIRGLTSLISDPSIGAPFSSIDDNPPVKSGDVDGYTGIVVDATGLGLEPSLIVDLYAEDGEPIYNERLVDPTGFREMGMAAFVLKEGSSLEIIRDTYAAFPIFVASSVDYIYLARRKYGKRSYHGYFRKRRGYRYRRRQGRRPLRVRAISIRSGKKIRTGAIISTRGNNKKLKSIARRLFRTARVVIITDAQVGGTEGRIFDPRFMGVLW